MEDGTLAMVLKHVEGVWRGVEGEARPWGMWIVLHAPLREGAEQLDGEGRTVRRAWFLDEGGARPAGAAAYERFMAVLFRQPWCARPYGEWDTFFEGQVYPIGWAAFAPHEGSGDLYGEVMFGRRYGYGERLAVERAGLRVVRQLWVA